MLERLLEGLLLLDRFLHGLLLRDWLLQLLLLSHLQLLLLLLLLLLHHLPVVARLALVELGPRLALLDLLAGGLGRDVDGADGLTVRVERSAGVLPLVPGPDSFDQKRNFAGSLVVHHLMLLASLHLQPLACPDNLGQEQILTRTNNLRSEKLLNCSIFSRGISFCSVRHFCHQ